MSMQPLLCCTLCFAAYVYANETVHEVRQKRQVSIDDLISGALNLVRPIFDTSQPLPDNTLNRFEDIRESSILGTDEQRSILRKIPLCKGDSRICQFISCSAENFKKDKTFSNIQLAAQILGDSKLRKAIASNPEAVTSACKEQGMDESECRVFGSGFQLINSVLGRIEKADEKQGKEKADAASDLSLLAPQNDAPIDSPDVGDVDWDYNNEVSTWNRDKPSVSSGSRTWSSKNQQLNIKKISERNDLVSSMTPFPQLPPIFSIPTPPPSPPLAFPTVSSVVLLPPLITHKQMLEFDAKNGLFTKRLKRFAMYNNELKGVDESENAESRMKRSPDYYDQLTEKTETATETAAAGKSFVQWDAASGDDYYGDIAESSDKKRTGTGGGKASGKQSSPGLNDCIALLGII